ncbi:F-box/LRR-repeat protein 7-like [Culicoides brevitarsis]|uniref:F-box/LRR-repeat protein 7-like n=1 Tax=Culicoides brevitarsis TaxID=469753 RepID=UPI00307BAE07
MSHVQQRAIECPLASLGHNTPTLDAHQGYHHPLSTSPLDTQAYQMLRKSQESPILSIDSDKIRLKNTDTSRSSRSASSNANNSDSPPQIYPRNAASTPKNDAFLSHCDLQRLRNQTYTPIETILRGSYPHPPSMPVAPNLQRRGQSTFNLDDDSIHSIGELTDVERFFLGEKMSSIFINSRNGVYGSTSSGDSGTNRSAKESNMKNSGDNSRYFHHQEQDPSYNYYSVPSNGQINEFNSPAGRRRASSPDTSGSDRYFLDRLRGSPNFTASPQRHHAQKSLMHKSIDGYSQVMDGQTMVIGRHSPLDQGYHTLNTPSPPSTHTQLYLPTATQWTTTSNMLKKVNPKPGKGFNRLSNDLVLRIFEWLDSSDLCNLTQVCKRFETLVWNPVLWRNIIIKGENRSGDKALRTIFRRLCGQTRNGLCPIVERVMLSEGCKISDKGLQLLSRRCPSLSHLQLQNSTSVTNQALFDLVTKCTNLQHLDITGCYQITTVDINPTLQSANGKLQLQHLDLTDCVSLNDTGLKVVVKNCPLLVYLYLRRCVQITDAGLKFVPAYCLNIKEISISDCINITDFGLYELAKLGANLRYLSVAKCERITDAGIKVIGRKCYKLRYLNARGCETVSDDSINILARACTRLRALDVGKCDISDAGLRALAESCPNLKKLSLKNCDMITDRGIQCIAYCCRGLQFLNIQDCQISLEGYKSVKKYCKRCTIEHTNPGFC